LFVFSYEKFTKILEIANYKSHPKKTHTLNNNIVIHIVHIICKSAFVNQFSFASF